MSTDRLLEIFSLMEGRDTGDSRMALCAVAAEFLALDGASIVLSSDCSELTSLCASNETARALLDLEIVVGEGPAVDACRGGTVNESNLSAMTFDRWPAFTPPAVALGAGAVFAFSIRLGAIRFGALSLFRERPGPLNGPQESDAYLMASVIGRDILAGEAGGSPGKLVGELDGASVLDFTVHQAAGMVAVQGSMSVRDALVTLRAHAFASNCEIIALAGHVVARRTHFDMGSQTWSNGTDGARNEG